MEQISEYFVEISGVNPGYVLMGNDSQGHCTVLIKSSDHSSPVKLRTDCLLLKTNVSIVQRSGTEMGCFHIIKCISSDIIINSQFKRIINYFFGNINEPMTNDFVIRNFQNLQLLFATSPEKKNRDLQVGIYGELIFLHYLAKHDLIDIAKKWHSNFYLKHDLELDEKRRIEIKTTTKEKRIHRFKHNQLVRDNIEVFIASIMLEETETGYSLFQLTLDTIELLDDIKQKLEIEKLIRICDLNELNQGIICDQQHVYDDIRFYESNNVPRIKAPIPDGVTSVQYDVSLEVCPCTNIEILSELG